MILGNIILGNRFISKNEGEKGIALFYNNENSSLTINSKNIYVSGNILNSTERYARLFYNTGILTLGSDKTDTITIENNEIKGECNNSLLYNYGIFNINASNISIKNNEISGCYFIYNAVYNAGTMNINLYGNNPTFEISGNKAGEENKKLTADIFLDKDSKLNFVNHSNNEATIILENGIKGKGSVIFKNEDSKNGSFKLELGSASIEANEMNIESNVTLLLSINSEGLIGGLEGYDDDSELNITDGKKLTIGINKKNVKNIGMGHSYTVVSNFRNLQTLYDNNKIGYLLNPMVSAYNKIFKVIFSIDNSNNTLHLTFSDKDLKIVLNTPTKNDNEILRMLNDILNNEYNENTYEVFTYLIDDDISDSKKVLLIEDILPSEVRDIVIESYSNMLDPIKNNILNDRLSYISHNNDNMLLLASNNNDDNYKDTIRKKSSNNTYELWSKISYNYGHDFNNSSNNIHTMGITLGMDYDINNDKYKIGFAYMFNI